MEEGERIMKVKANGIQMNYQLTGAKGAPVVMLSHSLGSSLAMWDPQMKALEPHYTVLRYDIRGHGSTDAPSGAYTLDQLAEDAICLMDALGIKMVHWVGLSLGGMIGQCLALKHGHRIQSLVLCDTAASIPPETLPMRQERINIAREKGMEALLRPTLERWFTPSYLAKNPPELDLIRKQFLATPVSGYIGCSQAILGLNYLERLSEIKVPTLIIVGEEDPGTPVEASRAMHERIRNCRLRVLPSASHLSNVEQAEAFNSALLSFLQAL
jgi:3-oxoadipate enol-lactonase